MGLLKMMCPNMECLSVQYVEDKSKSNGNGRTNKVITCLKCGHIIKQDGML